MKCIIYGWYGEIQKGSKALLETKETENITLSEIQHIIDQQEYKYDWYEIIFENINKISLGLKGIEKCSS